ncbi:MAG: hypothetical protein ACE144_12675 [Thermodesulfobacteriota bacterium]
MERKHKAKILLVIVISLLIPMLSAYTDYYVLMEADFLSAYPKFENTDLDCLLFSKKEKFTTPSDSSCAFWVGSDLAEHFSCFYYQATVPQVKSLILRC